MSQSAVPVSPSLKCPICLDDMRERAVVIPCCHDFDYRCISEWAPVNSNCPVCRTPMECIHHNIKSITSFSVQQVVPTASASADHDHDEEYDSSELEFNSDTDLEDMDEEGLTLSDEEWIAGLPSDSSLLSSPAPALPLILIGEEGEELSFHSPSLHTPSPPASPDSLLSASPGPGHADGTIVISSDEEEDEDGDAISVVVSESPPEQDEDLGEEVLIPEEGELIEVDPDDDVLSDGSDARNVHDYGDEPDDWTDDFDADTEVYEDDFGDGFDDSSDGW